MKKKLLRISGVILGAFILFNVFWFAWRSIKYNVYSENIEKGRLFSIITPRYTEVDDDGFDYLVKYPDYLSFTGNLSVGFPADGDNPFMDALIVWPKTGGVYEYGVLLYEENWDGYQIYIDAHGNAVDDAHVDIIIRHRVNIEQLLEKADGKWGVIRLDK